MNKKKLQYPACEYLPRNIINEMKNQTIQSKKDRSEHCFAICSSTECCKERQSAVGQMNNQNAVPSEKCRN